MKSSDSQEDQVFEVIEDDLQIDDIVEDSTSTDIFDQMEIMEEELKQQTHFEKWKSKDPWREAMNQHWRKLKA